MSDFNAQATLDAAARTLQIVVAQLKAIVQGDATTVVNNGTDDLPSIANIAAQAEAAYADVSAAAASAGADASAAAASASAAAQAAATSFANGKIYASAALGLAATTDGQGFFVAPSSTVGAFADAYRNNAGAAVLLGQLASQAGIDALTGSVTTLSSQTKDQSPADIAARFMDIFNFLAVTIFTDLSMTNIFGDQLRMQSFPGGVRVVDRFGFTLFEFGPGGFTLGAITLIPDGNGFVRFIDQYGFVSTIIGGPDQSIVGASSGSSLVVNKYRGGAYPQRPVGASAVQYIGPTQPNDGQPGDTWLNASI